MKMFDLFFWLYGRRAQEFDTGDPPETIIHLFLKAVFSSPVFRGEFPRFISPVGLQP